MGESAQRLEARVESAIFYDANSYHDIGNEQGDDGSPPPKVVIAGGELELGTDREHASAAPAAEKPMAPHELAISVDRPLLGGRTGTRPPGMPFQPVARPANLLRWRPPPSSSVPGSSSLVRLPVKEPASPLAPPAPLGVEDEEPEPAEAGHHPLLEPTSCRSFVALAIGATGVVFGDIGTSPLYAFAGIYSSELHATPRIDDVQGTFSMIIWALFLIVCGKYVTLVMAVSHHGEGGTFALLQTILGGATQLSKRARKAATLVAMLGCSFLLGDGAITPAISVLGALEGLPIENQSVRSLLTIAVLLCLFSMQRRGTGLIGRVAGPLMIVWFVSIGALGAYNLSRHPVEAVLIMRALDPRTIWRFWTSGAFAGERAWKSLGGVVLAFTGAEALYADLGHFGANPIRAVWCCLVFPSLVLQYAGQAVVLCANPSAVSSPFYSAVPKPLLWPMLLLATCAAVIASQALISGVFALLSQGHALGFVPRVLILHTNPEQRGQVYIPEANSFLCVVCILLVLAFRSSARLGAAYGVAVTADALVTTTLLTVVLSVVWRWRWPWVVLCIAPMLTLDLSFWSANVIKVPDGGWVPMALSFATCLCMHTYHWGRGQEERSLALASKAVGALDQLGLGGLGSPQALGATSSSLASGVTTDALGATDGTALRATMGSTLNAGLRARLAFSTVQTVPELLAALRSHELPVVGPYGEHEPSPAVLRGPPPAAHAAPEPVSTHPWFVRTPAVVVFLTPFEWHVPQSLGSLALALGCLPATIVLLTLRYEASLPFVLQSERISFEALDAAYGLFRIVVHLGYAEATMADNILPRALAQAAKVHSAEYAALRPLLLLKAPVPVGKGARAAAPPLGELDTGPQQPTASLGRFFRGGGRSQDAEDELSAIESAMSPSRLLALALASSAAGGEPRVTFVLNRLSYVDRGGHSLFTQMRIRLYSLIVVNARNARGVFGLPVDSTLEVSSVRLL